MQLRENFPRFLFFIFCFFVVVDHRLRGEDGEEGEAGRERSEVDGEGHRKGYRGGLQARGRAGGDRRHGGRQGGFSYLRVTIVVHSYHTYLPGTL